MIIKKPYAFLIKNFRIIHGLLFIFVLFLAKKTLDIYDFYNSYVTLHAYNTSIDLVKTYVTFGMFFATLIALGGSFTIYYILSLKNKHRKIYMFSMITYVVYIGFLIFMILGFSKLQNNTFDVETQRMYRDIAFMMLIPQGVVLAIIFLRTIGFNLRQFNFKRDLEEMNIEISDSEEVEVNIGQDSYKYARTFRKFLRLSKYFVLENKMFVIIISSVFILALSIFIFNKINIYRNKVYERAAFVANNVTYDIKEAYITQTDMNNIIINKNSYFILIKVSMQNKTTRDAKLNRDTFRLQVKDKVLHPNLTIYEKFIDMGNIYKSKTLKSGVGEESYVIFEINKEDLSSEYILKISSTASNSNDNSGYKEAIVKPTDLDKIKDNGSKKIPNSISLEESQLKKSYVNIESYEIAEKFKEEYNYELNGENKKGIHTIIPDKTSYGDAIILKLETQVKIDETAVASNYIKKPRDLYKYYGFISYRAVGKTYSIKMNPKDVIYEIDKYSYFEVPSNLQDADKIDIILLVRGQKYTFVLK